MHFESAMILLLCCGAVALAAAVSDDAVAVIKVITVLQGDVTVADDDVPVIKNDTALQGDVTVADDDAVLQDGVASLLTRLGVLEQRVSERGSGTPKAQEDLTNRDLLKAVQDAFARWGTPKGSDNGGPLMLAMGQMGAELLVLKAQTAAELRAIRTAAELKAIQTAAELKAEQTAAELKAMKEQIAELKAVQTAAELKAIQTAAELKATQTAAEIQAIRTATDLKAIQTAAELKATQTAAELKAMKEQIAELKAVQTAADLKAIQTATELKAVQTGAEPKAMKDQIAELKTVNNQTTAELLDMKDQIAQLKAVNAQTAADLLLVKTQTAADVHTLQNLTGQQDTAMQAVREKDRQREEAIQDARTSTYVRWGNSACGNASGLVYSGVVGGGSYSATGSAVNYLCMTRSPVMSILDLPSDISQLHGTEYETYDSHQDTDAVCAVCRAAFSTTVMIPGTDTCSPGWSLQYSGHIMSGHRNHKSGTEFLCVDGALESTPNSASNQNGALLYYTVAQCGSLPCGPYVQDKIVTCAVCSQ